jgi:hypothetical protein
MSTLGYDSIQTGKYLVWMTASTFYSEDEGSVIPKRCYLPNYQADYAVS